MSKITFEIENIGYELPDYISIENYTKIFKLKDTFSDEYFSCKLLNILSGCPIEVLLQSNYQQIQQLSSYAMSIFPKENEKFIDRFIFEGVEYGFLPSWKEFSFAEWIDIDTLRNGKDILDNIHILTAIYYRPIISENKKTKKYKIEKYESDSMLERAEIFKQLDSKIFFGTTVFFYKFLEKYNNPIQTSSIWTQMIWIWKNRKMINLVLKNDGDGLPSSTELVTMILQNTSKSLKKPWWKFSTIFHTSSTKTMKS